MLVLTVGLNVLGNSPAGAFSIAASLMCMIYALGDVSGANFNPAVTLAILASKMTDMTPKKAGLYMAVQIAGSVVAAIVCKWAQHGQTYSFGPQGTGSYGWGGIAAAEIVFTFVLCFVVLGCCTVESPLSQFFGFAIGSCVTVGGFAIGAVSGGALNPAVALGATIVDIAHGGNVCPHTCLAEIKLQGRAGRATHPMLSHSRGLL